MATNESTTTRRPTLLDMVLYYGTYALVIGIIALTIFLAWDGIVATFHARMGRAPAAPEATAPAARTTASGAAITIPQSNLPPRNPGGSYNSPAAADAAFDTAVAQAAATAAITPTAAPSATPTPAPCVLITWLDGSQSCDDGRPIDAAHSQPGYCTPIVWADGSVSCNDGKPSGKVVWPDPEIQAEPTNTPWPAAPTDSVQWTASDGPQNNTCVAVTFGDGRVQTSCSEPNVKLDQDDAAFVARMIQDGRIEPGVGAPKG